MMIYNGILLLDKPKGISSNRALQQVKKIYKCNRVGYIGTLDPLATGMLPICFGIATKLSQFLLFTDKFYYVKARLGQKTNTADSEGIIIKEKTVSSNLTQNYIEKILYNNFFGEIFQTPSIYSAIKIKGKPAYKYARSGNLITMKKRKIIIYSNKVVYFNLNENEIALNIRCSKGTYIRNIIDDLGELLKCGAHVIELRRLKLSNYSTKKMVTINYLNKIYNRYKKLEHNLFIQNKLCSLFFSISDSLNFFPEINMNKEMVANLKKNIAIKQKSFTKKKFVRITEGIKHKFIGIAEVNNNNYITPKFIIKNNEIS